MDCSYLAPMVYEGLRDDLKTVENGRKVVFWALFIATVYNIIFGVLL